MQRHGWTWLLSEILVASALSAAKPADLTIAMQFDQTVSPSALHEMKNEFERILRPAVPRIAWRMSSNLAGNEVFHEIVMVRFQGSCQADGFRTNPFSAHLLGVTADEDGELLPFASVDCGAILGMLSLHEAAEARNTFQTQRLLGRAMGRVLAHEVYHVVLKTRSHGEQGITKASLTQGELFGAELRFDAKQLRELSRALCAPLSSF
jgi:hypothetical protein